MKQLEVKAAIQIGKPVQEVFEAIVNPDQMRNYFISKGSGRLQEGKTITWRFPEFDFDAPVRVGKVIQDKLITFAWDAEDGEELTVEMSLTSVEGGFTVVRITEKGMGQDDAGLAWLVGNTEGWANFLACLKAYMEYGINLRKGAFDFMK